MPVNDGGLTSTLCVIVNPGHIENEFMDEEEQHDDQDFPFIFYFDAMGNHYDGNKDRIANKVRTWLNHEADRLAKFKEVFEIRPDPFNKKTMEMFNPKGAKYC